MADSAVNNVQASRLFTVEGLIVVITGGGSGLGAYMARTLALNGATKVFIIGRREDSLRQVAESIPDKSIIVPVTGDVTSQDSLHAAYTTIAQQVSHIDVLIANSGVNGPQVPVISEDPQSLLPLDELCKNILAPGIEAHADVFRVNVVGVQYAVATFLPLLDAANKKRAQPPSIENFRPRPQIITTGSIGGLSRRPLGNITYGPSKAAVMHMTKQLATVLVPYDIRVNSIAPGLYFSEMTQGIFDKSGTTATYNVEGTFPRDYVPATRIGDEEDMAGTILYLCSRAGAYVNGNVLVTDGGRLSVVPASY